MRENGNSFEVQWAYEFVFALHLFTRGIPLLHTKLNCLRTEINSTRKTLANKPIHASHQ